MAEDEAPVDEGADATVDEAIDLLQPLLDVLIHHMQQERDVVVAQDTIVRFAAIASQMLMFDVLEMAREDKQEINLTAQDWVRDWFRKFGDYLTNRELLATTAQTLGVPVPNVVFDRKFRRSLM